MLFTNDQFAMGSDQGLGQTFSVEKKFHFGSIVMFNPLFSRHIMEIVHEIFHK